MQSFYMYWILDKKTGVVDFLIEFLGKNVKDTSVLVKY